MKVLFVAGPHGALPSGYDELHGVEQNVLNASRVALECWKKGWVVVCPHLNTRYFYRVPGLHDELEKGAIELVRRCDAILMMDGWQNSPGAMKEHAEASLRGKRVFFYNRHGIPSPEDVP